MTREDKRKVKQQKKNDKIKPRKEKKCPKKQNMSFDKLIEFAKKNGAWES